ncbi:DNA internalization-related competence protein ComEC/Rec2 [Lactobacillus reuteri]|nr:DNA internalization-related competence protein ComEC/Rec2 [Limosilactobacillus reuteri]
MLGFCLVVKRNLAIRAASEQVKIKQTLLVYPDNLKISGNFMTGIAKDLRTGQQELISFSLRSRQQANYINNLTKTSVWEVDGQIQPIIPNTNENQFDKLHYSYHRRICNEFRINRIMLITEHDHGMKGICHEWRKKLSLYFNRLPYPINAYCQQLIIGNSNEDSAELMISVKKLGLLHLFCISGMHIVLLTVLLRRILVQLWWTREIIDLFLILLLPVYLIIGGGATSLIRATIMAELGLLHEYLHLDQLDGWSISLLIGLMIDPMLLLTLGGQLSYLLSFVLQVLPSSIHGFKQSLFLNLISLPSLLSYVYEVHFLSFLVSYLIIPLFGAIIFPAVLIGAVSFKICPFLTYVINSGLRHFQHLLDWLSSFPGMIHFGKPPLLLAILLFLLTLLVFSQEFSPQLWQVLILMYVITGGIIHFPFNGEVTFVDIGQGDSIIIREPFNRRVLMIDTGGKLNFRKPEWANVGNHQNDAQRITINYLKSKGISHLDAIYLSHHDADHIGYLTTILDNMKVKCIIVPAGMEQQASFLNKVNSANQRAVRIIPVTNAMKIPKLPLQILHPFTTGEGKNEDSLVLTGNFGGKTFLFTGDLDQQNEQKVIQKYPQLKIDILKEGHHGSKTSSNLSFLQTIGPRYAIISAGRFNRYHHPDKITIDHFQMLNINYLSTQRFGMIQYIYFGQKGKLKTTLRGDETKWTLPNYLRN